MHDCMYVGLVLTSYMQTNPRLEPIQDSYHNVHRRFKKDFITLSSAWELCVAISWFRGLLTLLAEIAENDS